MKNTFISILLFLTVLTFVAYSNYRLNYLCDYIEKNSNEIQELINLNSWQAASLKTDALLSTIKDNNLLSSVYLNHNDFDILCCEALKLSIYIECMNNDESCVSTDLLKAYATNIKRLHKPTLENIF